MKPFARGPVHLHSDSDLIGAEIIKTSLSQRSVDARYKHAGKVASIVKSDANLMRQ